MFMLVWFDRYSNTLIDSKPWLVTTWDMPESSSTVGTRAAASASVDRVSFNAGLAALRNASSWMQVEAELKNTSG